MCVNIVMDINTVRRRAAVIRSYMAVVLLIIISILDRTSSTTTLASSQSALLPITKVNNSEAFDDRWHTESDLENELEQKRAKNQGWSSWSDWSTCSRSCDGGVTQQLRRCHSSSGCKGDAIRYRICNMQPCPDSQDFRAHQCAAYNDVPYDGTLSKWIPHYDYIEPCALTCRGIPAHLPDDETTIEKDGDEAEPFDEPSVIVQLAARVQDGTRCRPGSLDMCIQGKCQRVGCDLKIGSNKKVDACGVCGGDGSSCSQPLYHWEMAPMSLCSVTCGGGYKMSRPTCRNRVTGADVEESLCSASTRPEPSVVQCNTHLCPPKWIAGEWGPCSRQCGGGYRERPLVCAEESNGIRTRVPDVICRTGKPPTQESCNTHDCPKWVPTEWSGCSVSCGSGIQIRGVECMDEDGNLSAQCDPHTRPPAAQQCTTGIPCHGEAPLNEHEIGESGKSEEDDDDSGDQVSYNDQPLYAHQLSSGAHHEEQPPIAQRLSSESRPSNQPTFIKDSEWSACSVTCGEGIRRKTYKCKIFLEYSRTIATINDSMCEGTKPPDDVERCIEEPCSLAFGYDEVYPRDSIKVGVSEPGKTYVWREQGYTSCSASCLGGVEELIINCVREDNGKVVSPFLCSPETKPEARVRTCNDRPCPPRWNYSDYTPCSKSCGIGIKTREVQCIHEVTRGGENTMVVPNNMCPQPPPADRQYCNVLDCPVRWEVSEWSKCSQSCGFGIKQRRVECKQIMAQEHKIERPESMCPSARPPDKKPCNVKPCPPEDPRPTIAISNSTYIQHDPKKNKITLKIGGAAEVFFGTQVKIKCPVKRFNRTKIRWSKNHKMITKSRKYKISKKGALRILDITFRDSGIYTCHAGLSSAEINIDVKAKPGGIQPEEFEKKRHDESDRSIRERSGSEFLTSGYMTEDRGKSGRNKQKMRDRSRQRSDGGHHADSNIMEDESKLNQHSQDLAPQTAASSSGSRTITVPSMPYFQALLTSLQYIWPKFHSFSDTRMLQKKGLEFDINFERLEKDEPISRVISFDQLENETKLLSRKSAPSSTSSLIISPLSSSSSSSTISPQEHLPSSIQSLEILLNKSHDELTEGIRKNGEQQVHFEWITSEWSKCSHRCGKVKGLKKRSIHCIMKFENFSRKVNNGNCEEAGLRIPDTFMTCDDRDCPEWIVGEWSSCQRSRCFSRNIAIQRRDVSCKYLNGTESSECDKSVKPMDQQECYSELCKGVWRVEPWSKCNAQCEKQGITYRIIQCVWYGTRRPAGYACVNQPRPAVMKGCKGSPCSINLTDCKDTSRYCRNVKIMGLCRLHHYQRKCCITCNLRSSSSSHHVSSSSNYDN